MYNIAIDGPSSAGKSTVAKLLAEKLNILHLDTGSMYRAFGLKAINNNIDPLNEAEVSTIIDNTIIEVKYIDGQQHIFLDSVDVSTDIRQHNISQAASDISSLFIVRNKLVKLQQQIASKCSCVLDGRDIATVVLPNATYKFYLTAEASVRAQRRTAELISKGIEVDPTSIYNDILTRDYNDSHREHSPLTMSADSIVIDCTQLTVKQVVDKILAIVEV